MQKKGQFKTPVIGNFSTDSPFDDKSGRDILRHLMKHLDDDSHVDDETRGILDMVTIHALLNNEKK